MRQKIRNMNIRRKLVFYSYLIITPILLLISSVMFVRNYRKNVKDEQEQYQKSVENLSEGLDTMLNGIAELGTYICINQDILDILAEQNPAELNSDSQLWIHEAPMRTIEDMIALSGQIKTLAIYPENGVKPYLRCMDAAAYLDDVDKVRMQEIYTAVQEKRGKMLFQSVGKGSGDTYQANRTEKIVMYREIYNLSKTKPLGYLVIGADKQKYTQLCENSLPIKSAGIVVVNEEGMELVRAGKVDEDVFEGVMAENRTLQNFEDYFIYTCKSEETGTTVYEMIHKDDVRSQIWDIAAGPLALLAGFLLGLYPILALVSDIVSKPLKKLCVAMESFEQGDFSQKVEVTTGDEVGEAAACFNQMVEAIHELINNNYVMALREKESELNALQAQINPHFLYNTLDSLYWQAVNEGNEDIADDIIALSNLFRLVLGQGSGIISVENEKSLVGQYLHLQKMRFSDNLEYRIEMSDEILEKKIPKLILQPFVENAVVHGYEKTGDRCTVSVLGWHEGEWLIFQIKDDGIGMNETQLKEIWEVPDEKRYAGQRIGRYAIRNVKERLDLMYHSHFELKIESEQGKGTCVTVKIPWDPVSGKIVSGENRS